MSGEDQSSQQAWRCDFVAVAFGDALDEAMPMQAAHVRVMG
jgi:hypothetical protein